MRNEQNDRSGEKRESQKREQPKQQPQNIGHTPDKAEGDEKTVEEALKNSEKRR